ncbi:MAG: hypothetical protein AMXMBFR58_35250 [Phycisphaerae bacterium]|nr:hypothetical protein [Phycisphaerales bacterium]
MWTGRMGFVRARVAAAVIAVGIVTIATGSALAQPGGGRGGGGMRGPMGDMFSAPVTTREIEVFTQVAGLTTDQKEAAATILEGYQEQFRAKATKVQREMEKVRDKFQESRDPAVWQEMRGTMQDFRAERKAIEEQFFADFKAILTPEQVERWPAIERAHRRSRTVSRGMMSGERVDLVTIIESSKFPVEVQASVIPVLGEYEEALDRELIARNKAYDDVADAFSQGGGPEGFARAGDLMTKGREASIRVREVNRKYARQLADMLPDDYKATFDEAVKRASYPEVYRTTLTSQQIAAAEKFEDLDQAQKDSLESLKQSYSRSLAAVNERLAAAITEREEAFDPRQMGNRFGRGRDENDAASVLRRERRELDESTAESLKKLLNAQQVERLPQEEEGREGGDRRRGGQRRGGTQQEI